ncbi:PREDICTED: multiple PDZ domain protein-like, partial [Galeopterus variegatus]|uniref:Multiple PDZ domain protein-like n=1 Tax=Galeopterus variegatus TaxID=482537 RepID=A0ABM0RRX4_GALVR
MRGSLGTRSVGRALRGAGACCSALLGPCPGTDAPSTVTHQALPGEGRGEAFPDWRLSPWQPGTPRRTANWYPFPASPRGARDLSSAAPLVGAFCSRLPLNPLRAAGRLCLRFRSPGMPDVPGEETFGRRSASCEPCRKVAVLKNYREELNFEKMLETIDKNRALQAAERLQAKLRERGDIANEDKLSLLKSVLQSPLFSQILHLQTSVQQLKDQVNTATSSTLSVEYGHIPYLSSAVISTLQNESFLLSPHNGNLEALTGSSIPHINGKPACDEFDQLIKNMAQGRHVEVFELLKPPCGGLGFSVVGLRSENRGELGIFVQEIQEGSVAHRDGRLKETDQILAINGQALDQTITHQQAISILQKAKDSVQLVIARGSLPQLISPMVSRSPSAASTISAHSNPVHWQHVETIELVNDGSGLGFGIIGGKATGVIVKTILPGGVADQ